MHWGGGTNLGGEGRGHQPNTGGTKKEKKNRSQDKKVSRDIAEKSQCGSRNIRKGVHNIHKKKARHKKIKRKKGEKTQ